MNVRSAHAHAIANPRLLCVCVCVCVCVCMRVRIQLLADAMLRHPDQPLSLSVRQNMPVATFLRLVDHPEMLHAFCLRWEVRRNEMRDWDRRDDDDGKANEKVKRKFSDTVMEMLPALASLSVPSLAFANDQLVTACLERVNHILAYGRPFEALNGDGLSANHDVRLDPKTGYDSMLDASMGRDWWRERERYRQTGR